MKAHGLHYVEDWLTGEVAYTQAKFGIELDDEHTKEFSEHIEGVESQYMDDTWWSKQLYNYLYRAYTLGLDNPNGRQALAKFVATGQGMLMSAVRVYGPLPYPGVSSGENLDKLKELY